MSLCEQVIAYQLGIEKPPKKLFKNISFPVVKIPT
jgi:hypothetical protein